MLRNFIKVAFRQFRHNKLFTLINISGLAIGISAALVIYLIVQHEFNYDRRHPDGDRIFRVVSRITFTDMELDNSGVPIPTGEAMRKEVTGIDAASHFLTLDETKVAVPSPGSASPAIFRKQDDLVYADEFYFNIFQYNWLAGSPQTALKDPFQVVLTESVAKTYFANLAPALILGREIIYDDSIKAVVSGVVSEMKEPTDFVFKQFISRATIEHTGLRNNMGWDDWGSINSNSQLFVRLQKGSDPKKIESQLAALRDKYREKKDDDKNEQKDDTKHSLQPITDIHFNDAYDAFEQRQAHRPTLYGLLAVAVFLLLLGCINFINLTTAQAVQRAKEIGIRKTMGSAKSQLILQFLSETFVLTLIATILSVIITPWLLHVFRDFIPPGVSFASLNQPHVWVFLPCLVLVVSVLAGFYPALVLSKFRPVTVLKNQAFTGSSQTRKAWLRKSLTVTQFVIAQFLIIAMLVVSKQIHFSLNKDLGYKRDAIVTFNTRWNYWSKTPDTRRFTLLEKIKAMPEIEGVSLASSAPASNSTSSSSMKFDDGKKIHETMVEIKSADTGYFNLYQLRLLAGRVMLPSDTIKEFVINETYAKFLGFKKPGDAIGKVLQRQGNIPIVGVVADFHTKSTHSAIKPLVYTAANERSYSMHLALRQGAGSTESWKKGLAKVEKEYKLLYPEDDFKYEFYDQSIANFYKTEQNISRLLKWSAGLCIFISCLGLLGLAVFITNSRTKEIGVRKVLGATVTQIVGLLSKDFVALVLLAFIIATPCAWFIMNGWLEDFVYRTSLSWWIFAVTGAGMILLSLLILGFRAVRSAMMNPVKSLRTE